MSERTTNLDMFKWDTTNATDLASQFDIEKALFYLEDTRKRYIENKNSTM